ncbi:phenylalanine--tRNA ligase subunit beta [Limisphaera sp. VF-2]|jgi:phenylalanyl-tRNA synthetase beta chain|uniref:phenylalanine--tRNA ligase subunit beta n=1 Tax=Limisphaera sp. VF-2 TaxID=3400418 RepID=UPI001761B43C
MKIALNWLRQYVDVQESPEALAERLTMLGIEVEGMQRIAGEFEGIVVAQILTREKVPGSDKLSVCRVFDGQAERTIICGAQNHKPGDKVALILPGHALPRKPGETEPFVIRERKVFGIVSQGMMCSAKELGLSDDGEGLWILPPEAPVGQPLAEYLGRSTGDVVFDLEITPNRPDLNSVLGIARELAAATGRTLRFPEIADLPGSPEDPSAADSVDLVVEAADLCPRYVARVIRGVQIGPSPEWLKQTLERVGLRSINNVVDVTNYVMLECGQPLHAFDADRLARDASGRIGLRVRRARDGERFVTLDGQEHTLNADMLLIADATQGVALAGIMGGQNSEVTATTRDVLIESAWFQPANIRRTSKALGLRSESSYRFERGADPGLTDWASRRCAQLILQTAGGRLATGSVEFHPSPTPPRQVTLRFDRTRAVLGVAIPPDEQRRCLEALQLKTVHADTASATFEIPSWRHDLKRETDLIEEIERLYGVERIPATPPRGALGHHPADSVFDQLSWIRRLLCGMGLDEAQGQTLISEDAARLTAASDQCVRLANPLSSDMNTLRPSLLPGLLQALRHNVTRKNLDVALFEIGRVFRREREELREERRLAWALTGRRHPVFWTGEGRDARFDLSDARGVLDELLEQLGLRGVTFQRRPDATALFVESATVHLGPQCLGELGLVSPLIARAHDLRDPVVMAELNLDLLLARRPTTRTFRPLPVYPAIRRDVAMVVPENVTHADVLRVVHQARVDHLEQVQIFDVFRGGNIPAGHKSLAYAFTYRAADRTLTDAEANALHARVVEALKQGLHAVIREG